MGRRTQAISPHHEGTCFMEKDKFYLLKLDHIPESAHHSSGGPGTYSVSLSSDCDLEFLIWLLRYLVSFIHSFINSAKDH